MADPLLFAPEEADRIFEELGTLRVDLDDDPLAFGPKRLNKKVAEVRRMLDRCERIFLDVSQRLYATRRALRIATTEIDLAKKSLFANDPETRAGRSVADREAIASGKLSKSIRRMNELESSSLDLEQVLSAVKSKRADLKDTEGRLKDQVRLCQEELGLGHNWGSMVPSAEMRVDLRGAHGVPDDAREIANIIATVEGEVHLARETGDWMDPVVASNLPEEKEEEVPPASSKLLTPITEWDLPEVQEAPSPKKLLQKPLESFPLAGTRCSVCREPQYQSPSGLTCPNGHGGADPLEEEELLPKSLPRSSDVVLPGTVTAAAADSFLSTFSFEDAPVKEIKEKKVGPKPEHLAEPDFLADLLADFESNA